MATTEKNLTTTTTRSKRQIVDINDDNEKSQLVIAFEKLFPAGKEYESISLLRSEIAEYGLNYNVVMSTKNSNDRSIHLWCKHGGTYRNDKIRFRKAKPGQRPSPVTKVIKPRKKETQRTNCGCYIKAKLTKEVWVIERSCGEHNHPIPENLTVYSIHRKQSDEVKAMIFKLFEEGHKTTSILEHLKANGIENIIKKDVENLQQQFRKKNMLGQGSDSIAAEIKEEDNKAEIEEVKEDIQNIVSILAPNGEPQQESEQEQTTHTERQDNQLQEVEEKETIECQLGSCKLSKNDDIPHVVENTPLNHKRTSRKRKVAFIDVVESIKVISPEFFHLK